MTKNGQPPLSFPPTARSVAISGSGQKHQKSCRTPDLIYQVSILRIISLIRRIDASHMSSGVRRDFPRFLSGPRSCYASCGSRREKGFSHVVILLTGCAGNCFDSVACREKHHEIVLQHAPFCVLLFRCMRLELSGSSHPTTFGSRLCGLFFLCCPIGMDYPLASAWRNGFATFDVDPAHGQQ